MKNNYKKINEQQLDGAIGALDTLAGITDTVGDQITILFDSGIRRGAHVFKAMALGAKIVLVAILMRMRWPLAVKRAW